jgi:hypothetical protein
MFYVFSQVKVPFTIQYQFFQAMRSQPFFNPFNSCLSKKQNNSRNLILFAIMKAYDLAKEKNTEQKSEERGKKEKKTKQKGKPKQKQQSEVNCSEDDFKQLVYQELLSLGVNDIEKPLKAGGTVDKTVLDQFIHQFYVSSLSSPSTSSDVVCPATVSVIGSIISQEVIKVVTSMYLPIQQLLMFESFSSLSLLHNEERNNEIDDTSGLSSNPYNKRMNQEMKKLKVFIIGSGAIGCELLKNFALLGIGCSKDTSSSTAKDSPDLLSSSSSSFSSAEGSLWKKFGLEEGGIIVTDMDLIEKSNLNRQLLFRSHHIGQSKAMIAAEEIMKINPSMNILPLSYKVDENNEKNIFNEQFWKEADIIITALVSHFLFSFLFLSIPLLGFVSSSPPSFFSASSSFCCC